jgi:hypothetical protein
MPASISDISPGSQIDWPPVGFLETDGRQTCPALEGHGNIEMLNNPTLRESILNGFQFRDGQRMVIEFERQNKSMDHARISRDREITG